jgi:Glu-tRNA(Gln) amidotransferase subunit E-like FAD-binding protein
MMSEDSEQMGPVYDNLQSRRRTAALEIGNLVAEAGQFQYGIGTLRQQIFQTILSG